MIKEITEQHNCYVEYTSYIETSTRVEECHGYHTFEDSRVTNVIERISININDFEIDITDLLTDEQKQIISESL